ncbi:MAG: hypothetical protein GKR94_28765 [Gammaproteobacteria bacterium]|nr:hypothetical protein [Gammaproteobacteria bacterium]
MKSWRQIISACVTKKPAGIGTQIARIAKPDRCVRPRAAAGRRQYGVRQFTGGLGPAWRSDAAPVIEHATAPDNVYAHAWRQGDTLVWDNRCMVHRTTPYDSVRYRRWLERATVTDPAPAPIPRCSEAQLCPELSQQF